ncbi:MAG: glutamine synthetase type III, partial [Ferruginibacter sp.]
QIEARVMGDLASTQILPATVTYQNELIQNLLGLKEIGLPATAYANQLQILETISMHMNIIADYVEKMIEARKVANELTDTRAKAIAYCEEVKGKYFDHIRYHVDKLELMVGDKYWPLPKYRELLFLR